MKVYPAGEEQVAFYEGLVRLSTDKDFQRVVKWLFDSLHEQRRKNDALTDTPEKPLLSRSQGKCQTLDEILKIIADCKDVLEKLKK